jgi:hypothetical protein
MKRAMKWLALLIGLLVTLGAALQIPKDRVLNGENDFLSLYSGARLSGSGELHSIEAHQRIAKEARVPFMRSVLFTRPDYYALLLRPLGWFSYRNAYWLFQGLSLAALGLFLWLVRDQENLWMLALCSIPLVTLYANGQDVMLIGLALMGAFLLERRGSPILAGLLLSFCTIKFHLFLFTPIALVAHRKWRVCAGALGGVAAGILAATVVEGPQWIGRYARLLRNPEINPTPFPLNFHAALEALNWSPNVEWFLTGSVLAALVWMAFQRVDFGTLLGLCVLAGMLASRHLGLHDYALLLPCSAMSGGRVKSGFFWLATPPVYVLMLLPAPWGALAVLALSTIFLFPAVGNGLIPSHSGTRPAYNPVPQ